MPNMLLIFLFCSLVFGEAPKYELEKVSDTHKPLNEAKSDLICVMGSYDYQGVIYSDRWEMKEPQGMPSCEGRKKLDAEAARKLWKENNDKIKMVIDFMLAESKCSASHDQLRRYVQAVEKHKQKYEERQLNRSAWVNKHSPLMDLQRNFAYLQQWDNICSGQFNRKSSFIDLDFINRILFPEVKPVQVSKDGETVTDCSHVTAFGSDDLKGFRVSLAKATGTDFLFAYDFYGVPDQVIIKSGSNVLLDSGCRSTSELVQLKIPLAQLAPSKMLDIEIKNNCTTGNKDGSSSWELALKCESKPTISVENDLCLPEKELLIDLLKKQVDFVKAFLNIADFQKQCMAHMDKTVLAEMFKNKHVGIDLNAIPNELCDFMSSEECSMLRKTRRESEINIQLNLGAPPQSFQEIKP